MIRLISKFTYGERTAILHVLVCVFLSDKEHDYSFRVGVKGSVC